MKHAHHILPKHAGGTDDPSNLVELTVAEHAEAHRVLYEKHGRWQDKLAWVTLSGQITIEAARRLKVSLANKGKPKSPEHRAKMSEAHKGHKHSEVTKEKQRQASLRLGLKPDVNLRWQKSAG